MARLHSKSRKLERGLSRTTETRATTGMDNERVDKWVMEFEAVDDSRELKIQIMVRLINEIWAGTEEREVLDRLLKRKRLFATLIRARERVQLPPVKKIV